LSQYTASENRNEKLLNKNHTVPTESDGLSAAHRFSLVQTVILYVPEKFADKLVSLDRFVPRGLGSSSEQSKDFTVMITERKFMTEEELLRLPDDGFRYELVEGELRQMALTDYEHGRCTTNLSAVLATHVRNHQLGDVLAAETGFVIARTADGRPTVRAADVAFVARGRIPAGADTTKYLELAPDFIVETLSPGDTAFEVEEKIALWLAAGVRIALTVNPGSRSVTLYRSLTEIKRLTDQSELDLGDVVTGFRCRVSEIFD